MSVELHHNIHEHIKDVNKHQRVHEKKWVKTIDDMVMIVGIIALLTSIPQIYQLIITQDGRGVSILTWFLYILSAAFWLLYGIAHEEKPIIINNLLWMIFEFIVVVLAAIYR
jgi:uncharacterized protein with PQ loop repeat